MRLEFDDHAGVANLQLGRDADDRGTVQIRQRPVGVRRSAFSLT